MLFPCLIPPRSLPLYLISSVLFSPCHVLVVVECACLFLFSVYPLLLEPLDAFLESSDCFLNFVFGFFFFVIINSTPSSVLSCRAFWIQNRFLASALSQPWQDLFMRMRWHTISRVHLMVLQNFVTSKHTESFILKIGYQEHLGRFGACLLIHDLRHCLSNSQSKVLDHSAGKVNTTVEQNNF